MSAGPGMDRRIAALRRAMVRKGCDAVLISEPRNRRYLSGYSAEDHGIGESTGHLLIGRRGAPLLLTDSRFQLQAEDEAPGFQVELYPRGLTRLLADRLPRLGVCRLGFESGYMLHATFVALGKKLAAAGVELLPLDGLVERQRLIKDEDEIERLRAATRLGERVFQEVHASLRPGMGEIQVALAIEERMRLLGAEGTSFATIVAGGPHAARPHAVPTERPLAEGETVLIDMGLVLDGYCSDMTRTFVLGKADETLLTRHRLVRRAQLAAMAVIRAGVTCRAVDQAARLVIREGGYGEAFGHALGHGVGLAVHEEPRLSSRSRRVLAAGMVVTVEPGIYLRDWGGIRLENMVVVREQGCEPLNADTTALDL